MIERHRMDAGEANAEKTWTLLEEFVDHR